MCLVGACKSYEQKFLHGQDREIVPLETPPGFLLPFVTPPLMTPCMVISWHLLPGMVPAGGDSSRIVLFSPCRSMHCYHGDVDNLEPSNFVIMDKPVFVDQDGGGKEFADSHAYIPFPLKIDTWSPSASVQDRHRVHLLSFYVSFVNKSVFVQYEENIGKWVCVRSLGSLSRSARTRKRKRNCELRGVRTQLLKTCVSIIQPSHARNTGSLWGLLPETGNLSACPWQTWLGRSEEIFTFQTKKKKMLPATKYWPIEALQGQERVFQGHTVFQGHIKLQAMLNSCF